jgi:hypothetical protein
MKNVASDGAVLINAAASQVQPTAISCAQMIKRDVPVSVAYESSKRCRWLRVCDQKENATPGERHVAASVPLN